MIATTIGNFSKQFCKYLLLKGPLIWHGQKQRKDRSDKVKPIKSTCILFPNKINLTLKRAINKSISFRSILCSAFTQMEVKVNLEENFQFYLK